MIEHAVMPVGVARLADLLHEARERTLRLVEPLSEHDLTMQHDALMSPVVWDLGHIAHFEDLWLTRNVDGHIEFGEMPGMYNPFDNPRRVRGALALPACNGTGGMMDDVRHCLLE